MATEIQHQLDLVIDVKKPHWTIVQDMLTLYKSAMIYSNGKYKIISDRNDLPVRQVFHAGNMVGRAEVRIAKDPAAINQLTAEYSNRTLGYERDIYILQDSATVIAGNAPIKNSDVSMTGITRPTEVARRLDFHMQRSRQQTREVTFQTGLEAVAVEPGDRCIVGVLMTDFEMGYGGRVLEGSLNSFVADREVSLSSGSVYDLWIWHTVADTPEQRTISGSTTQIRIVPTSPFLFTANSGDRWAIGVQSEELISAQVKKVTHQENGMTQIVADEFIPITIRQDCPDSNFGSFGLYVPSQPTSVTMVQCGCYVCFNASIVSCQGGLTRGITSYQFGIDSNWASMATVLNNSLHPPVENVLVGNTISFVSGANSGQHSQITLYTVNGSTNRPGTVYFSPTMTNVVASGTSYYVTLATTRAGYRVDVSTNAEWNPIASFFGNSGCVNVTNVGTFVYVRPTPFSRAGIHNQAGTWGFSLSALGCFDPSVGPSTSPQSISTQSLTNIIQTLIPSSLLSVRQPAQMRVVGLVNDTCNSGETSKVSFGLIYVASTIINSLVIDLRTSPSASVGTNAPFTLKATFTPQTLPTTWYIRASLEYIGAFAGGSQVSTLLYSSVMSIDFVQAQSMAITVLQSHTDTTGAVHSHGCHSVVLDHAEFELFGEGV